MSLALQLKNITKDFTNERVINNVSLDIEVGKIVGLVGRNGSGKSVLFKIICGLFKPTLGEVIVFNENITKTNEYPKNTRAVIENPHFLEFKSGYQNLEYLSNLTGSFNKKAIEEALSTVNLEEKDWNKKVKHYSLGMKQKLAFAQAIMDHPKLIILDEPFNGLEESSVIHFRKLIKELQLKGTTIVLASHIMEDIDILCDNVYEIKRGNLSLIR